MPENNQKPPIYLLDTMAFIFRAYHAMQRSRPMSTRTGIPTAATYVFVNMINKLRADFKPEYMAAVYDVGKPVHRHELADQMKAVKKFNIKTQQFEEVEYGGYKANRAETPPDLIQQQPYIRRALEAFRIPIVYYEGFEADDVIGTLSCQYAAMGHQVYVVSSDKDMMQLVNEHVSILNPMKDNLILDSDGVEKALGVRPERVIDVMALRGDAIDNVPGAPGIGDKGSVDLIQQFGTVEAAMDAAVNDPDSVKRKTYRESLANNRENILLSKELVTIHTSVPIELALDAMKTQPVDANACRQLFSELEFTTLLKDLAPDVEAVVTKYEVPADAATLQTMVEAAREAGGLSIALAETAQSVSEEVQAEGDEVVEAEPEAPATMDLFAVEEPAPVAEEVVKDVACKLGLAATDALAIEVPLELARAVLEDESLPKRVHDLKAVLRALEPHGVTLRGHVTDVMLESYLLNPTHGSHTLVDIAARSTSRALTHQPAKDNPSDPLRLAEAASAVSKLALVLGKQMQEGVVEHVIAEDKPELGGAMTLEMLQASSSDSVKLSEASTLTEVYEQIDRPLVPVLLRMEQVGVRVDLGVLGEMGTRLGVTIDDLAERIYASSGHRFNINSPKQLGDVLFNKMDLPKPMKYGKGKVVSTAQDILEDLAQHHEVPSLVLEHRQLQKLKSTYLDQLPLLADADARIHTTFNQVGTATGRLSSTNPNLQNIPIRTAVGREIRAAFVAAPGNVLLAVDYSQIELRLMAHFSQDPLLLDAYKTGKDIHTLTAAEVFEVDPETMDKETRARAKAVNFGIVYGISPFGLAAQLGIDQKIAREYIAKYFERYQGVAAFIERTLEEVRRTQAVKTAFGRVRPIPDIQSRNPNQRGFAERTAVNTPLQGTAADLIKVAMIRIDAELTKRKLAARMTLQVHDELLFDVPEHEVDEVSALVKDLMESAGEFSVPIVAEVGRGANWRDAK
ncbi:DNA polymerase I [Granulicella cerasi]|uniref:DNA polymerase I n=1 Tax=Granulicella cerasi TaxID=741063 RepID=A0ABW1Z927_9BACT|nr:DNA polymerase I [Granulicella cerasi]